MVCHGLTGGSYESYVRNVLAKVIAPRTEGGMGGRAVVVNVRTSLPTCCTMFDRRGIVGGVDQSKYRADPTVQRLRRRAHHLPAALFRRDDARPFHCAALPPVNVSARTTTRDRLFPRGIGPLSVFRRDRSFLFVILRHRARLPVESPRHVDQIGEPLVHATRLQPRHGWKPHQAFLSAL